MSRFLPVWLPGAPAQAYTMLAAANVHPLQTLLNGSRLGLYEPCRRLFNRAIGKDPNEGVFITAITAGAFTGCIGGNYFLFFYPLLAKKSSLRTNQKYPKRLSAPRSSLSRRVCKPTLPISPLALSTTTKTRMMPSAPFSNLTASLVSGEVSAPPSYVPPWSVFILQPWFTN